MSRFKPDHRSGTTDKLPASLTESLSPSEVNTLLLEVFHRQTRRLTPAQVLAAYRQNRFVRPAAIDPVAFREFELLWVKAAQERGFEPLELSPLAPLGCCSVVGTVHQDKVLSATRGTEVVADATNLLALESGVRRQAAGFPPEPSFLCAAHRHVRAPRVDLPGFSQHFTVFCLTSAGRDSGHFEFEQENIARHIRLYVNILQHKLNLRALTITLKALDAEPERNPLFDRVLPHLQQQFAGIEIDIRRIPQTQQQYYRALQFGICWEYGGRAYPIADGGLTTWTQQLTGNRKERFVSSGIGIELLWKVLNGRG